MQSAFDHCISFVRVQQQQCAQQQQQQQEQAITAAERCGDAVRRRKFTGIAPPWEMACALERVPTNLTSRQSWTW